MPTNPLAQLPDPVAAEITQAHNDSAELEPMVAHARLELESAGVAEPIGTEHTDGGSWNSPPISAIRHTAPT